VVESAAGDAPLTTTMMPMLLLSLPLLSMLDSYPEDDDDADAVVVAAAVVDI